EGDVGERRQVIGRNSHGPRSDELGSVRDNVVGGVARDLVAFDSNRAQTSRTASGRVWLILRIGGQVPFEDSTTPVARGANGQLARVPGQVALQIAGRANSLLGEI